VPHTVEEAYELADAARRGDDAKLLDELGDVLFQVHFLAMLLEERGAGSLADVAEHVRQKLIRRHPHVFPDAAAEAPDSIKRGAAAGTGGEVEADTAGEVLRNWDAIKREEAGREPGLFGEVPDTLPGPLYARKVLRRASSGGVPERGDEELVGDLLFDAVALARRLKVDPELALRAAADRFRRAHE
jgi:XTP/dITP diphosphohydrolase/tetrapyrrole methylase family protein/MazG family protein/ATP diphosphatase